MRVCNGWGCFEFQLLTVAQGSAELGFAFLIVVAGIEVLLN